MSDIPDRQKNLQSFLQGNHPSIPDVVYHGTKSDINEFLPFTHFGTNTASNHIIGMEPNSTPGSAHPSSLKDQNIIPVHVSMKRPLDLGTEEQHNPRERAFSDLYSQPVDVIYHAAHVLEKQGDHRYETVDRLRKIAEEVSAKTKKEYEDYITNPDPDLEYNQNLNQMKNPLMKTAAHIINLQDMMVFHTSTKLKIQVLAAS